MQLLVYFCRYMNNKYRFHMKKFITLFLLAVFMTGLLTGCKKKPPQTPILPPEESMVIDFSNFETGKSADFSSFNKGVENSNWEFAALVAGYWRTILTATIVVPVNTFKLAVDQTPVWLKDEEIFQWSYSASVLSVSYKARLTAEIRTSDVLWKLYITKEGTGGFAEFLWVEGTSKTDGTSGQWTLYHSYTYQEELLQIDWTKTATGMGTVKYTYIRDKNDARVTDPFKNSYIEYGKTTVNYDAFYGIHYYNGQAFSDVDVEWSTTGFNGRVMASAWFGDSSWHCWNGNLVNITCP